MENMNLADRNKHWKNWIDWISVRWNEKVATSEIYTFRKWTEIWKNNFAIKMQTG